MLSARKVSLKDFRSLDREIPLSADLTILCGPNAAGKTSVLEALQILTTGDSFRRTTWSDVVSWGHDSSHMSLSLDGEGRDIVVTFTVSADGKRALTINGKRKNVSSLRSILPSVLFTPDDLGLIKSSGEIRRRSIDQAGAQMSASYARLRTEYEKVLRQRNTVLRDDLVHDDLLTAWTERLITVGSRLYVHRRRLFDRMIKNASSLYEVIAPGEHLTARYLPSWEREGCPPYEDEQPAAALERAIDGRKSEELARRTSLCGPHKDEITFLVDERDARTFASQGQQRTIALVWKLAELQVITDVTGRTPLLLLDDVMSELDGSRRETLLEQVAQGVQTVVTTTNLGYFSDAILAQANVVEM